MDYPLYEDHILVLPPGTIIECKCGIYFKVYEIRQGTRQVYAANIGDHGCLPDNSPMMYSVERICLPVRVVTYGRVPCMFGENK